MQYLLFLLAHPAGTFISAAAPSFSKNSYKLEENGTSSIKLPLSARPGYVSQPTVSD